VAVPLLAVHPIREVPSTAANRAGNGRCMDQSLRKG
jgi:hypothetical protein